MNRALPYVSQPSHISCFLRLPLYLPSNIFTMAIPPCGRGTGTYFLA